ncbi:MAG: AraC family transcriptional regulator [Clostridiales bacterium]|nr:AraC family transcriptional regulator [Clostridiales bacterium]
MQIKNLTEKAAKSIEDGFAHLSGIDELAMMLGVTKCHLIRTFTTDTGAPPGKCLAARRISAAMLILRHRDYSIDTVANMVGYSGANYFCKAFRRAAGESPGAYRQRQAAASQPPLSTADKNLLERLDRLAHT